MATRAILALIATRLLLASAHATQDPLEPLKVDEKAGTVSFGAKAAKTDVYPQLKGVIEYLVVMPRGKEYESCFIAPIDALAFNEGLQKIGLKPGKPAREENGKKMPPEGSKMRAFVEWKDGDKARKEPIESFVLDTETGKPMAPVSWVFSGSRPGFNPETERTDLLVVISKNLMALHHGDNTVLITNPTVTENSNRYKANKDLLPKEGTPVRIIYQAVPN